MTTSGRSKQPEHGQPRTYRITVRGLLEKSWASRLADMNITGSSRGDERETVLIGRLQDQAALFGVLNTLYELHLPVLSIELLDSPQPAGTEGQE